MDAGWARHVARRRARKAGRTRGFQLWIALPPELEMGPTVSIYQAPEDVPEDGPARVLLGSYGSASSAIASPSPINYLAVRLKAGERWRYEPRTGHTVLWVAIASGVFSASDELRHGDLAAFEPSSKAVEFGALTDSEFVLGSVAPREHDLVLGHYSVHMAPDAPRARRPSVSTRLARGWESASSTMLPWIGTSLQQCSLRCRSVPVGTAL